MRIAVNIGFFVAFLVNSSLAAVFILNIFNNRWFLSRGKGMKLAKKKCEICGGFSFLSKLNSKRKGGKYWRCPHCESLNRGG